MGSQAAAAKMARIFSPDGPFPLVYERVPHYGTVQNYRCWQQRGPLYPNSRAMMTLCELFLRNMTDEEANSTFLVYKDERYTFSESLAISARLASFLIKQLGIVKGDKVAIASRNYPEWILAFIGITLAGGVVVPLNSWWKGPELEFGLTDSGAKAVFADPERLEQAVRVITDCMGEDFLERIGCHAIGIRCGQRISAVGKSNYTDYATASAHAPLWTELSAFPGNALEQDACALLMYTSGTTSKPKGVLISHRGVMSTVNMFAVFGFMAGASATSKRKQEAVLMSVPLFHATGSHAIFLSAFLAGRKIVLMYKWDALRALQLIEREKISRLTGVPTMSYELLHHPRFSEFDTSSLSSVGGGGAPMPPTQALQIHSKFRVKPSQGYGLTETNALTTSNNGDAYMSKPTSCGRPMPTVKVCIVDDANRKLPPDDVGELLIHGPTVMLEYYNRPDKTAEAFHVDSEGVLWFRSGDIARIDQEGFVYILDRAKDLIIRGGENISCAEVEAAVYEHAAIQEAAVIGIPHPRLGEEVGVAIVAHAGAVVTAEEVMEHCRARLAKFKCPTAVFVWDDPTGLPKGATGKILKRNIREHLLRTTHQSTEKSPSRL